jgi:hypothetical protein
MPDPKFIDRIDSDGKVHRHRVDQGWTEERVDASMRDRFGYRGTPNRGFVLPLPDGFDSKGVGFPAGYPEYAAWNERHRRYGVGRRFKDQFEFETLQQAARIARPAEMSWQTEEDADALAYDAISQGQFDTPYDMGRTIADDVYDQRRKAREARTKAFNDFSALAGLNPRRFRAMVQGLFPGRQFKGDEERLVAIQKRMSEPMAWSLRRTEGIDEDGEKTGLLGHGIRPSFVPVTPISAGPMGNVYSPQNLLKADPKRFIDRALTPMRLSGWKGQGESGQNYNIPAAPKWMLELVDTSPRKARAAIRQHFMTNIPDEYAQGPGKNRYIQRVVPLLVQHAVKLGRLEASGFTGHHRRPKQAYEYYRPKYQPDLTNWENKRPYREAVALGIRAIQETDSDLLKMFGDPDAEDTFWKARDFFTTAVVGYVNSGRLSKASIRYPATLFRKLADSPDADLLMAGVLPDNVAKLSKIYRRISDAHADQYKKAPSDDSDPQKIEEQGLVMLGLATGAISHDQFKRYQEGDASDVYEVLSWLRSQDPIREGETGAQYLARKRWQPAHMEQPEGLAGRILGVPDIHGQPKEFVVTGSPVATPMSGLRFGAGPVTMSGPSLTQLGVPKGWPGAPIAGRMPSSGLQMMPRIPGGPIGGLRGKLPAVLSMYGAEQAMSPAQREAKRKEAANMSPAELAELREESYWAPSLGIATTALAEVWGLARGLARQAAEPWMADAGFVPQTWVNDKFARHARLRGQTDDDINTRWRKIMGQRLAGGAGGEDRGVGEAALAVPLAWTENLATDGWDVFKGLYTIMGQITQLSPSEKIKFFENISSEERMKAGGDVRALEQDERFAAHVKARGEDWAEFAEGMMIFLNDLVSVEDKDGNFEVGAGKLFAARPLSTALTFLDGARLLYHSPLGKAMGALKHQALGQQIRKMDGVIMKSLFAPAWISQKVYGRAVRYFGDKATVSKELAANWLADNGLRNAISEQRVTTRDVKNVAQSLEKGTFEQTFSMLPDESKVVMLPYVTRALAEVDGVTVPAPLKYAEQLDNLLPEGVLGPGVTVTQLVADAIVGREMRREAKRQSSAGPGGNEVTLADLFEQHTDRGSRASGAMLEDSPGVWANGMNSPFHIARRAASEVFNGQTNANPAVLHVENPTVYARALGDIAEEILRHDIKPELRDAVMASLASMADEASRYVPLSEKAKKGMALYETRKRAPDGEVLSDWGADGTGVPTWVHPEVVRHLESYVDMHRAMLDDLVGQGVIKMESHLTDLSKDSVRLRLGGMIDNFHRTHRWKFRPELPTQVNQLISKMQQYARPRKTTGATTTPRSFIEHTLADWIAAGWWEKPEVVADIIRMQPEILDGPVSGYGTVADVSAPGALTDTTTTPVQRITEAVDTQIPSRFYPAEPTRRLPEVLTEEAAAQRGARRLAPDEIDQLGTKPLVEYILGRATREAPDAIRSLYVNRNKVTHGTFLPKVYKGEPMSLERWRALPVNERYAVSGAAHAAELRRYIKMAENGKAASWRPGDDVLYFAPAKSQATVPIVPGADKLSQYKQAFPGRVEVPNWEYIEPIPPAQADGVVKTTDAIADVVPEAMLSPAKQVKDGAAIVDTTPTRPEYLDEAYRIDNNALQMRVDSLIQMYNQLNEAGRVASQEALTGLATRVTNARKIRGGRQRLIQSAQGWDQNAGMTVAERDVLKVIERGENPNTMPAWFSMPLDEFRRRVEAMDISNDLKNTIRERLNEYGSISGDAGKGFRSWFGLGDDQKIMGTDMKVEAYSRQGMDTFAKELQFLSAVQSQKNFLYKLGASFKSARSARQISTLINNTLNNFVMQMIVDGDYKAPLTVWRDNTIYKEYLSSPSSLPAQSRAAMKAVDDTGAVNTSLVEAELGIYDKALLEHFGDAIYNRAVKDQFGKVAPGIVNKLLAVTGKAISTPAKYLLSLPGDMIKKVYAKSDNIFKTSDIYRAAMEAQDYFKAMKPGDEMRFRQSEMRWSTVRRLDDNLWEIDGAQKKISEDGIALDHDLNLIAAKEGALRTNRKFFDYSDLSPHQMFMRKTQLDVFVSPFYSWTYKSMWVPGLKRGWAREMLGGGKEITTNSAAVRKMLGTKDVKRILQRQLNYQMLRQAGTQSQDQLELLNRMLAFRIDEGMPAIIRWMAPNVVSVDSLYGMDPFRPQKAVAGVGERAIDYITGPDPNKQSPMIIGPTDQGIDKIQEKFGKLRIILSKYTEDERAAMFGERYRKAESVSFKKLLKAGKITLPSVEKIIQMRQSARDAFPGNVSVWTDLLIALGGEKGMVLDVVTELGKLLDTKKWKQINAPTDMYSLVNKIVPYIMGGGTTHAAMDLLVGEIDPESPWSSKRYTIPHGDEPQESTEGRASRLVLGLGGYYRSLGLGSDGRLKRLANGKVWKGGWLYRRIFKLREEWKNAADTVSWAERDLDRKLRLPVTRQYLIDKAIRGAIINHESELFTRALEDELVGFKSRLKDFHTEKGIKIPESFEDYEAPRLPGAKEPRKSILGLRDVPTRTLR